MYTDATKPGDVADHDTVGKAEGESIWNRMAAIIRARSLDVRILMDAHDAATTASSTSRRSGGRCATRSATSGWIWR